MAASSVVVVVAWQLAEAWAWVARVWAAGAQRALEPVALIISDNPAEAVPLQVSVAFPAAGSARQVSVVPVA